MLQSHTATQQWQSFEIRMRRKRVDRCVLRAAVAIDAGMLEDAREALEEVERLDSHEPAIEPLRAKLAAAESRAVAKARTAVVEAAAPESLILNPAVPVASLPEKNVPDTRTAEPEFLALPETQRRVFPASAAAFLIAISGTTGWFVFSHNAPGEPAAVRADTAVVYDSNTGAPRATPTTGPAVPEPAVRVSETAVNAAAMSEPVAAATAAPLPVPSAGEPALNNAVEKASVEAPRPSAVMPTAEPPSSTSAASNTTTAANNSAPSPSSPPPAPANDRRAVPASLEPSPPLPELAPPPPVTPASNVVPSVSSTDGAASSVAPAAAAPPAETSAAAATVVPATPSPAASQQAEENRVRGVLRRYEAAYSALDADAASAVWPGVDRRALTSAFQALSSQNVSLGRCDVRLTAEAAQADCKGTARWQPKVGGGPQTAARQWRFDLRNAGGDWVITRATVR